MDTDTKVRLCPRCGSDGPFYEGHTAQCKPCRRQMTVDYSNRNREAKRARDRAYYHANKERAAELRRANYLANKERDLVRIKKWQQENRERHLELNRQKQTRRRARQAGNGTENYERSDIWDRDHGICGICDLSVDRLLQWPHGGMFTIDHVVPISLGGADVPENVQVAHLACNIAKSARS